MTVAALFVMGTVASIFGYLPEGLAVIDKQYNTHAESAGGTGLAVYIALLLIPGIAVAWRPRRPAIAAWILWAVPLTLIALYRAVGPGENLYRQNAFLSFLWPGWAAYSLVTAMLFAIVVVVPNLRARHRRPPLSPAPRLPRARIHRS